MKKQSQKITRVTALLAVLTITITCQPGNGNGPTVVISMPAPAPTSTPVPTVVNRGLAWGVPCEPPCWEGLTPGVSTTDEVIRLLRELKQSGRVEAFSCGDGGCAVYPLGNTTSGWVLIQIEDDVAQLISGRVDFGFSAHQLIELVGHHLPSTRKGWRLLVDPVLRSPTPRRGISTLLLVCYIPMWGPISFWQAG